MEIIRKLYNYTKNTAITLASMAFLMSGPYSYIAYADPCDPDSPAFRERMVYRQTNDILYFDECASNCSTGGSEAWSANGGGASDIQKVVDEAVANGKADGVDVRIVVSGGVSAQGGEAGQIPSASLIKLLVAAALSVNNVPLAEVNGDLLTMIRDSNNDAANRLIDRAGGFGAINAAAAQLGVGGEMSIGRKLLAAPGPVDPNTMSAQGSDALLTAIKQSADGSGKISKEYANSIITAMKAQTVNTKWGASGIPPENMAHKTGELGGAQHDVGYFINGDKWLTVSIMTNQPGGDGSKGVELVKTTAKKIYDAWGGSSGTSSSPEAGCCSNSGSLLAGDNNAERVYNYLIGKGYTPEQAAGIVGNMILESGVAPMRKQGTGLNEQTSWETLSTIEGSNIYGWGIVQWDPPSKVVKGVKEMGGDPNQLNAQLDFLTKDDGLNGGASDPKKAASSVKATKTVDEATNAFMNDFEHPQVTHIDQRLTYAHAIYNKATKGEPLPPEVQAAIYGGDPMGSDGGAGAVPSSSGGSSGCGSAADNGECQNPFRDLKNSGPLRLDGGMDYGGEGGSGPVYPACPAKIVNIYPTESVSGWPGIPGSYITYEVTAGKAKGKFIYIAEDCTPKVQVGQEIGTNEPICDYVQKSAYLEIGWSEGGNNQYIAWTDYPKGSSSFASNSGQDMSRFLESLGAPPGLVQGPLSDKPVPADWPKW